MIYGQDVPFDHLGNDIEYKKENSGCWEMWGPHSKHWDITDSEKEILNERGSSLEDEAEE